MKQSKIIVGYFAMTRSDTRCDITEFFEAVCTPKVFNLNNEEIIFPRHILLFLCIVSFSENSNGMSTVQYVIVLSYSTYQ